MEWYEVYRKKVDSVFATALERIEKFPPPLNRIGIRYVEKFNPAIQSGQDYICVLLPFWMKETVNISDEQCERLALANVYGMLYFFIQDDVMDSGSQANVKGELALANCLHLAMLGVFHELFTSDSPFWSYYDQYVTTWADCVVNEGTADYFMNDPIRTAGKASPVKLSSTGACLLAEREALIPSIEAAVDISLMTLQMLDDWVDWQDDLADGSYNGLIAMIAREVGGTIEVLSKDSIEASIYIKNCMKRYAEIAIRSHERLLEYNVFLPSLLNYHSYMAECLTKIADNIDRKKHKLLGGGINLLS